MALVSVFPTPDVHLLLSAGGLAMELTALVNNADVTTAPGTSWTGNYLHLDFDAEIVQVTMGAGVAVFTPRATGLTFGVVRHTSASGERSEGVIRVWVHERAEEFWIANRLLSVHADRNDYVPTVMARFADGSIGDVTDSPAFEYFSTDAAVCTAARRGGRVLGMARGFAALRVVHDPLGEQQVPVDVLDPIGPPQEILTRIRGSGRHDQRRNILFLPEGFVEGHADRFFAKVEEMAEHLFSHGSHSPFKRLKDSFIVWGLWEPSREPGPAPAPGITIAYPMNTAGDGPEPIGRPIPPETFGTPSGQPYDVRQLDYIVGLPVPGEIPVDRDDASIRWLVAAPDFDDARLSEAVFAEWRRQRAPGYLPVRNTRFGLMQGTRSVDPRTRAPRATSVAEQPNPNTWYQPFKPPRWVQVDPRRGAPSPLRMDGSSPWRFLNDYFATLRPHDPKDPSHGLDVGQRWRLGMPDQGLTCFICDDETYGAWNDEVLAVTLGAHTAHSITTPGPRVSRSNTSYELRPKESVVSTISHEFGHSFGLGDDYEGFDFSGTRRPNAAQSAAVEAYVTLSALASIAGSFPGQRINVALIKWNHDRIAQASRVEATVVADAAGDAEVRLTTGQGRRWQRARDKNQDVFLRNPDLNDLASGSTSRRSGPLRVANVGANDVLTLVPGPNMTVDEEFDFAAALAGGGYPAGSALYQPKRDSSGAHRTLIHPRVLEHMRTNDDALTRHPGGCDVFARGRQYPPDVGGFDEPRSSYQVIGLYEGGGTYNCDVFRPTGMCKMRQEFSGESEGRATSFCHVCRYIIINAVDPSQLSGLDDEYPEDC